MANGGLDPRVNRPQGRQFQVLAQLLLQKKRQQDLRDTALRNAEINAGQALLKDKDPSVRQQGLLKILGAEGAADFTPEKLKTNALEQMVQGLMGDVFTQKGTAPGFQKQALESLTGQRELGDVQPQLDPVSGANVSDIEQDTATSKALEDQRKVKTAILQKALNEAESGNKKTSTTLLSFLIKSAQQEIAAFEKSLGDPVERALAKSIGDEAEEPEHIAEAREELKDLRNLAKQIVSGKFPKEFKAIKGKEAKKNPVVNRITTLQTMLRKGLISEDNFKAQIKALSDSGVPRETIFKALNL